MGKESRLIKSYLKERGKLMRSRWLTLSSWWKRSQSKTRYTELDLLLNKEVEFNAKWCSRVERYLSQNTLNSYAANELLLTIKSHGKKHKERGVFLVIFGTLVAIIVKLTFADWVLSFLMMFTAALIASERIFNGNISTSLDELADIVELARNIIS